MNEFDVIPYRSEYREQLINIAIRAWQPVFDKTRNEVPRFVYENFWPRGWQTRQVSEVSFLLDNKPESIWLALQNDVPVGFVGIAIHPDDRMGEIAILAVSPDRQRRGIGKALMDFAEHHIRDAGMKMVMVETVGDSGHEPARRAYEARGYQRWPVARYFKKL